MNKNIKKYSPLAIFIVVFFWALSHIFWDEYINFRQIQQDALEFQERIESSREHFSYDDIWELWDDITMHVTPDLNFLEKLVSNIDGAQDRVWLEVYIFTEKRILAALKRAHNRWIDVKVLLENNPYMAPHLNNNNYNALKDAWVPVKWSDPLNYALNHSKFIVIDDISYVSTGNYSYSSFNSNRDIFLELRETSVVESLAELFEYDYNHKPYTVIHPNIITSPENSRQRIEWLFDQAEDIIYMYFAYMSDKSLLEKVIETAQRGVEVHFVTWEDTQDNSQEEVQRLRDAWVYMYFMRWPNLHTKAILSDKEILYIWSINFSYHSFDSNREVGILVRNQRIIEEFIWVFESDIKNTR